MKQIEIGLIILGLIFVFLGIPTLIIFITNRRNQHDLNKELLS